MNNSNKDKFLKQVECPWCGESIFIKPVEGVQKCKFCRRLFNIFVYRKGKTHVHVEVECVDFVGEKIE